MKRRANRKTVINIFFGFKRENQNSMKKENRLKTEWGCFEN